MRQRISRLESLITNLVAQQSDPSHERSSAGKEPVPFDTRNTETQPTPPPDIFCANNPGGGVIKIVGNQSLYHGPTHWGEVLEEVRTLP